MHSNNCIICGKEIEPSSRRKRLYCPDCKKKAQLKNERKYYRRNREIIREKHFDKYNTDPEYRKKVREYQAKYQQEHREELRIKQRIRSKGKELKEWTLSLPRRRNLLPVSALSKHSHPSQKSGL